MATRTTTPATETTPVSTTAPRTHGPSINRVALIGRPTADPQLRYTANGHAVTRFRLATNTGGEANFHDIVVWRHQAEIAAQYLTKGRLIYVGGRLKGRDWTGRDGVKRYSLDIIADELRFLSPRPAPAVLDEAA